MPEKTSPIITKEFLRDVRAGKVYVPKYQDLKLKACPEPPSALEVQAELIQFLEINFINMSEQEKPLF
jgi:hypothetical protein